jgi:hypothetical protein
MKVAALVLVWSSVAAAEIVPLPESIEPLPAPPPVTIPAPEKPRVDYEAQWRPVYELLWRHGGPMVLGVPSDSRNAFGFAAGVHHERLTLLGEYSLGGIGYHPDALPAGLRADVSSVPGSDGLIHRFGAVARYAYAKAATDVEDEGFQVLGDLYVDLGAGVEVIRWDNGGTLVRPDLAFGIGGEWGFRVSSHQRGLVSVALRMHVARRDDRDGLPEVCSAPCTSPTSPTAWSDRSYMLELGYTFGR